MQQTKIHDQVSDRLLRVRDAAAALAVSDRKVWHYLAAGTLEPVRLGRATRIRQSDLDRLIRNGVPVQEEAAP